MRYKAVRSYNRKYTGENKTLNEYLEKGWEVVHITPFISNSETECLEYILREPKRS